MAKELSRGALVQRIDELAGRTGHDEHIQQILAIWRETMDSTNETREFSECCAILEYFESFKDGHYVVWCGSVQTSWGDLGVMVSTPTWSVNALHQFFKEYELNLFQLVRPCPTLERPFNPPFGCLTGVTQVDCEYVDRLRRKLDGYPPRDFHKGMLTASYCAYDDEPTLLLSTHAFAAHDGTDHIPDWSTTKSNIQSLTCYWEDVEGMDDDAIVSLPANVVRVMRRMEEKGILHQR